LSGPDQESVGCPSQAVWNAEVNLCVLDRPVKSAGGFSRTPDSRRKFQT